MHSPTHIEHSSVFLKRSQGNGTDTFSSSHVKFQQFFPLSISLLRLVFLWSKFKSSFSWSPGVWTQIFLHGYFHQTCFVHGYLCQTFFVHTRRPRTMWRISHKAKVSHATLYVACENHVMKLLKPIFACHNLDNLDTGPFSNIWWKKSLSEH